MRALRVGLVLVAACGFESHTATTPGTDVDAADPPADAPIAGPLTWDVVHVRPEEEQAFDGTAAVTLGATTIDTTGLVVKPDLPQGARLIAAAQDGTGMPPELAILEVGSLVIEEELVVSGTRPLVIIARTTIELKGTISARATGVLPGPGGALPSEGVGAGTDGVADSSCDGGGAGGGFNGAGGTGGGTMGCGGSPGATPGMPYSSELIRVLEGGSGGGHGSACSTGAGEGGGGGGAIQLSAGVSITLEGSINAGGGGGAGSVACSSVIGAGGGGGAGGAIYIQTQAIVGMGMLAANGGGGGGGGDVAASPSYGTNGSDGLASTAVAPGGIGPLQGGSGGAGAAGTTPPTPGEIEWNAGGGGGAPGRIYFKVPAAAIIMVTTSPMFVRGM